MEKTLRTKEEILNDVYTKRIEDLQNSLKYYEKNTAKDKQEIKVLEGLLKQNKLV